MKHFLTKLLNRLFPKGFEEEFKDFLKEEIERIYEKHMEEAEKEEKALFQKLKKSIETPKFTEIKE